MDSLRARAAESVGKTSIIHYIVTELQGPFLLDSSTKKTSAAQPVQGGGQAQDLGAQGPRPTRRMFKNTTLDPDFFMLEHNI